MNETSRRQLDKEKDAEYSNSKPLVSIGLPVYNGSRYLALAIEALLEQDFVDFELIISDNASTDDTAQICEKYKKIDKRIRYIRNETNIGAAKNASQVFEFSSGEYFMWAAHDDIYKKEFITKCLRELEQHPDAVFCCSEIEFIDENGAAILRKHSSICTVGKNVQERVYDWISRMGWFEIYSLIRTDALKKIRLGLQAFGSDVILMLELLMQGNAAKVPEKLFKFRLPSEPKTVQDYMQVCEDSQDTPYTNLARELLQVILDSHLEESVNLEIKQNFVEIIGFKNHEWRRRILQEYAKHMDPIILSEQLYEFLNIAFNNNHKRTLELLPEWKRNIQPRQILNDRSIYIWGTGEAGRKAIQRVRQSGLRAVGFIDNNPAKWSEEFEGLPINSSLILENPDADNRPYVLIGSCYVDEISKQLREMGYDFKHQLNCTVL